MTTIKRLTTNGIALAALLAASTSLAQAQTELTLWYHGAGNEVE